MKITLEIDGFVTIHEYYTHDKQLVFAIDKILFTSSNTDYFALDVKTHEIVNHRMKGNKEVES